MAKVSDEYFKVAPWEIIEEGFDPSYQMVGESVFSLANEYMGVRGCFEEGYLGETLSGSYFNGVYVRRRRTDMHYKGDTETGEIMVNSVNWLKVRLECKGEVLDLHTAKISDFRRVLDLQTGLLTRSFVWELADGGKVSLRFERLLSMEEPEFGAQRIFLEPLDFSGELQISLLADNGVIHQSEQKNFWDVIEHRQEKNYFSVLSELNDGLQGEICISSEHWIDYENEDAAYTEEDVKEEKVIGKKYHITLKQGKTTILSRLVRNRKGTKAESGANLLNKSFDALLESNRKWWYNIWKQSDIVIEGDEKNQQGIRFCIFQMYQTYHGANPQNNIGAKGLTGEAYAGNTFWDTETYCLPFYMLNMPQAAKNLLKYRYRTLLQAKERAKALDCAGAFYPISTISGRESCNLWQHASLQLQASTGVAYGIWFYEKMSQDLVFLKEYGAEMLVEISRMLATRGDWSADKKTYGYYCVMGPDEFQMMVNNNCYTNYMGKFTMNYTIQVLEALREDAAWYGEFVKRLGLKAEELLDWKKKADAMLILKQGDLYEQHDGFFKLPHVDVDAIPIEDFPLYHTWSYERLFRNDMIKQPDVLMLMLLFNRQFTKKELKANYEYYEPRCIHESSLSPSVHSILAAQLGKEKEAYDFFGFATRLDLDNYNRNTKEGLHTTSIAAAWMNIVYGFGGVRTDGEQLSLSPSIPADWKSYSFHLLYRGVKLQIQVTKEMVKIMAEDNKSLVLELYGEKVSIIGDIKVPLKGDNLC